jgi:hypothetical protein
MAAVQDLVNTNSRILKEPCYSFVLSKSDELPKNIVDLFYDFPINAENLCLENLLNSGEDCAEHDIFL